MVELCAIVATVPDILPGIAVKPAPSTAQLSAVAAEEEAVAVAAIATAKPTVTSVIAVAISPAIVRTRIGVTDVMVLAI